VGAIFGEGCTVIALLKTKSERYHGRKKHFLFLKPWDESPLNITYLGKASVGERGSGSGVGGRQLVG